jgi:hypothetical protein
MVSPVGGVSFCPVELAFPVGVLAEYPEGDGGISGQ